MANSTMIADIIKCQAVETACLNCFICEFSVSSNNYNNSTRVRTYLDNLFFLDQTAPPAAATTNKTTPVIVGAALLIGSYKVSESNIADVENQSLQGVEKYASAIITQFA